MITCTVAASEFLDNNADTMTFVSITTKYCIVLPAYYRLIDFDFTNVVPLQSETPTEPKEEVREAVEKLLENNLALSDKPLDDGVLASLSAMFGDNEKE